MKFFIFSFFIVISIFIFQPVFAYNFMENSGLSDTARPAGYDLDVDETTLERTLARNIALVLSFVGVIFVILIIYSGIVWMTAQGNDEKVNSAKKIMTDSIIGLIIVIAAYAITYFVLEFILNITWNSSSNLSD
jgi:hypothetical protein